MKESRHVDFGAIQAIFFSYRGHSTSWHNRAREEVKGQMEKKRKRKKEGESGQKHCVKQNVSPSYGDT